VAESPAGRRRLLPGGVPGGRTAVAAWRRPHRAKGGCCVVASAVRGGTRHRQCGGVPVAAR
jgi:hypothetical protein